MPVPLGVSIAVKVARPDNRSRLETWLPIRFRSWLGSTQDHPLGGGNLASSGSACPRLRQQVVHRDRDNCARTGSAEHVPNEGAMKRPEVDDEGEHRARAEPDGDADDEEPDTEDRPQ